MNRKDVRIAEESESSKGKTAAKAALIRMAQEDRGISIE